jgi:ABC-type molybdate transport system substrate-binding protein
VAHFNVYRSRGGYGFEVTYPEGRLRGWRPTRRWAKRTARREALDVLDINPSSKPSFSSTTHDRPMPSTKKSGMRYHKRSRKFRHRTVLIVALVAFVAVAAASSVVLLKRHKTTTAAEPPPSSVVVYADAVLRPVMSALTIDFRLHYNDTKVQVVYGFSADFESRAKKGDIADIYIDEANAMNWLTGYVAPDGTESKLGYDVMELIVRGTNPKNIRDLKSLGSKDVGLAVCAQGNLCGFGAESLFKFAQLPMPANAVVLPDAATSLNAVAAGQVDVAMVYRSDWAAHPTPGLHEIPLDPPTDGRVDYEIRRGRKNSASSLFMSYITSSDGANRLRTLGLLSS